MDEFFEIWLFLHCEIGLILVNSRVRKGQIAVQKSVLFRGKTYEGICDINLYIMGNEFLTSMYSLENFKIPVGSGSYTTNAFV